MAADELVGNPFRHRIEIEAARFLRDLAVEIHLEQEVAEFLADVGVVAALDGVHCFVGLLDEVRDEGFVGLLGVPRAAARRAQAVHDGAQPL